MMMNSDFFSNLKHLIPNPLTHQLLNPDLLLPSTLYPLPSDPQVETLNTNPWTLDPEAWARVRGTYTYTYTYTYIYVYIYINIHTQIYTYTYIYMYTYIFFTYLICGEGK